VSGVVRGAGAVARATVREVLRRRGVVLLLLLLPLSFYAVRRDLQGQSVRMLALGLGWAVSTLALFTASASRSVDLRLRISGMPVAALVLGRAAAVTACGGVLAAGYAGLVAVDQDVRRYWAVVLLLVTTVLVAAPLGAVVATFVPRDLEGALALLTVLATQMLADPAGSIAKGLPFWSTRELGTYAIDGTDGGYLTRGLLHFAATWVLLVAVALGVSAVRLRLVRLPRPLPEDPLPAR
jgi:hypothetical protein